MKSFLLNAGRFFALIFMSAAIMFSIRSLFEHNQPLTVNLAASAIWGLIMGSYFYYRAKQKG
jgi:magnesium-transporting ATPase (P-type)